MQNNFFELPPESYHGKLPFPPSQIIPKLRSLNVQDYKGLFLKTDMTRKSEQLTSELSKGMVANWSHYNDLETLSSCLNHYFVTLSSYDPLIPLDLLTVVIRILATDDVTKEKQTCKSIFDAYKNVSLSRYLLIAYLFDLLHFISENKNKNNMDSMTLASAFAPLVANTSANGDESTTKAIAFLIDKYDFIFPNMSHQFQDTSSEIYLTDKDIHRSFMPSIDYQQIKYQIAKASFRENHAIRYLPKCQVSKSAKYKRPQRPPPPNPTSPDLFTVDMLESALMKLDQADPTFQVLSKEKQAIVKTIPNYEQLVKATSQKPHQSQRVKSDVKPQPPKTPPKGISRSKTLSSKRQEKLKAEIKEAKAQEAPVHHENPKKEAPPKSSKPTDADQKKAAPAAGGNSIASKLNKFAGIPMGMPMGMPIKKAPSQPQENDAQQPQITPTPSGNTKVNDETPIDVVPEDTGTIIVRNARGPARRRPAALQNT